MQGGHVKSKKSVQDSEKDICFSPAWNSDVLLMVMQNYWKVKETFAFATLHAAKKFFFFPKKENVSNIFIIISGHVMMYCCLQQKRFHS